MPSPRNFVDFSVAVHLFNQFRHQHRAPKKQSLTQETTLSAFFYLTLCQTSSSFSPSKAHFSTLLRRSRAYWNILPKSWLENLSVITATLRMLSLSPANSKSLQQSLAHRKENDLGQVFPTFQRQSTSSSEPGPNRVHTSGL